MSLPFMSSDSEESATQAMAFIAVAILTLGLMVMNVSGAIAGSIGLTPLAITIRAALAVVLAGAELLAAVAIVRVMLAPNRLRKALGLILFVGLAWACIQNGKRAVHLIYPEFTESAALLTAKAGIAGEEAALISEARDKAINATPEELARVRTDIAALKAEQQLMASQSPEKIKEAQALLIAQGKYFGRVDGLRETLTEAAMRSRGEEIGQALTTLALREEALAAGAVTAAAGVAAAATNPAILQADLEDKARKAKEAAIWLEVMLWVFEGARSLGLWVYVTTITSKNRRKDDQPGSVSMSQAEYDDLQRAKEVHDNIKAGAEKGASTRRRGKKLTANEKAYRDKISDFMLKHAQGISVGAIAEANHLTVDGLRKTYGPHMTVEEHDALFFVSAPKAETETEAKSERSEPEVEAKSSEEPTPETLPPETEGGEDISETPEETTDLMGGEVSEIGGEVSEPDDELTIPDEPKEYGIEVWQGQTDEPANEDDDEDLKEAASV